MKKLLFLICILLASTNYSQSIYFPLNHSYNSIIEKQLNAKSNNAHTGMRPFICQDIDSITIDSSFAQFKRQKHLCLLGQSRWSKAAFWTERKLLDEDLFVLKSEAFKIRINPLFDFAYGKDTVSQETTYTNSRGVYLEGQIGAKFFFNSSFLETQATLLPYVQSMITSSGVIPGQGRFKPFKKTGYDFNRASALLSYSPNKYFNFQFGQDKLFVGDGYRSLLLSDNSFNYPFFKVTTKFWKIQYTNIYTQLVSAVTALDQLFPKKFSSSHYLSYNVTQWLNIGLFETIMWSGSNGRGFDFQYLNPIIFLRPVEYANGSSDNALIGATAKVKLTNKWHLYGQLLVDEFNLSKVKQEKGWWANKWGVQAGTKVYDLFTVENLSLQLEFNMVRPYTYSHNDSLSNYSNFNQALAHPLGANFMEGLGFLRYNYKRLFFEVRGSYAEYGTDTSTINYGQNIFLSYNNNKAKISGENGDFGHTIAQGRKNSIYYSDIKVSLLVNPKTNMRIETGWMRRAQETTAASNHTQYFYIGFKTALFNYYTDY